MPKKSGWRRNCAISDRFIRTRCAQAVREFVKAEPGGILAGGAVLDFARRLPVQTDVTVAGIHYLQEDSPDEIGRAIAGWMGALG